jgi:hypothetical protein
VSQYLLNNVFSIIKQLMDAQQIGYKNPALYQTLLGNVQNQNSELFRDLMQFMNQNSGGAFAQGGLHQQQLTQLLQKWTTGALNYIDAQMQRQGVGYNQQPQGGMMFGGGGSGHQYNYNQPQGFMTPNTTAGLYDSTPQGAPQPPAPPPIIQTAPEPINIIPEREPSMDTFDLGRTVSFRLMSGDTLQHHPKPGNVVETSNYREGDFEQTRISTIDIELNTAENSAWEAVGKALAWSPNEVMRGLYANVIEYKEIVHIPMKYSEFVRIAQELGKLFYSEEKGRGPKDWREVVTVIGTKFSRGEHKVFEDAILRFLNPSIFKFLRTSGSDVIEHIDGLDDLKELDDPRSKLAVAKHSLYQATLNEMVTRAIDTILHPSHLIGPDDINFGDFVHCDKIEFWSDGRSKYDYGTFENKADRLKFIDGMMEQNTVLRVSKNVIVTNAIDAMAARNIANFRASDSINMDRIQNVGCKLILELDQIRRGEIECVVCIDKDEGTLASSRVIHLGRTLDGQHVLVR